MSKALDIAIRMLQNIGCIHDGPVTGKFDEPGSAKMARDALAEIQEQIDWPIDIGDQS